MMNRVVISLASNCDQVQHLQQARQCLAQMLSACHFTEAIWTEPYSSTVASSAMYLNQIVAATTALTVDELTQALKDMERQMGRTQEDRRRGIVRIDLDLLQYNRQRYHLRDWDRPYIQTLLPSIEPFLCASFSP